MFILYPSAVLICVVQSGITTVPVAMTLSGPDAGLYSSPAATALSVQWGAVTVATTLGSGYELYLPLFFLLFVYFDYQ